MKILFLTSGSVRSNFSYRALSLARELKTLGHDTALVCPSADKYNGFEAEKISELHGVRVLQPWQFKTKRVEINLFPYIFGALYRTLREKPDLIYIYKPTPASIVGLAAKILRRTPVILDMDDLGSEVMKIEGHPRHQQVLVRWCESTAARYADMIVTASSYLFDMYKDGFPEKPVHLMPNGIDEDWFSPVEATDKDKRIVYMGSLNRKNIIEPLLDSFPKIIARHPDTELLVMGDGKYFGYFKDKCDNLRIGKHVTFTGWLPIEKARGNLKAGDIGYCFMPDDMTTRAASNMKTPQYMMRGVVPFVSRTGDLPETVDEGQAGYIVENESMEDIRDTLTFALEDRERKGVKARTAREFAARNFAWSKLAGDFDKWLKGHGVIPGDETEKTSVFFVCGSVPGNVGGPEIRNLYLLRSIVESTKMTKLFCVRKNSDLSAIEAIESAHSIPVISAEATPALRTLAIRAMLLGRIQPFMERYRESGLGDMVRSAAFTRKPSVIHLAQPEAYYMLRPHIKYLKQQGIKIVFDCHNVEIEAFRGTLRSFPWWKKLAGYYLMGKLKNLEIEAAENADAVFACSTKDADYFQKYNPNVYIIPNGVDCGIFRPSEKEDEATLIFIGGTDYAPNADALRFFLRDIYPKIRREVPETKLLAIGATEGFLRKNGIQEASVSALGFVDDIGPYLDRAAIGICPVRYGSGTRLKVLTFMASGLPVVSTTKGAEGISYCDGENIAIADTAESFAETTIALLRYRQKRRKLGESARELMLKAYDWDVIAKDIRAAYADILATDTDKAAATADKIKRLRQTA